jgi:signal transduction histidine kinase
LSDALTWLATQMQENHGLDVSIQTNGVSTRFEDTLRVLLFQAVREALFNIVKHAQTLHAVVKVEKTDSHIQITVSDGGVGFPPDSLDLKNGTGGLAHLRRRVRLMGCDLHVESQSGKGSRVILEIPAELVTA